jgi:pimeloyl-ACP methyl ester carboxylesterase
MQKSLVVLKNPLLKLLGIRTVLSLGWMLFATGCMFTDLKNEIAEEHISYSLEGQVASNDRRDGEVIVLLYSQNEGGLRLDKFTTADETGRFFFIVTPGSYRLAAFEDHNANHRHDPGEPAGAWLDAEAIKVWGGPKTDERREALSKFMLILSPGRFPIAGVDAAAENLELMATPLVKLGELADWDDPVFDEPNGTIGFWRPMTFLKKFGTGVYFMEPYDSNRIPILFIHGANGTPRGWQTLADSIDKRRFQIWVYYYPTGLRLDRISSSLNDIIKMLQNSYGFEQVGIVAHSMGGLVGRSFILKHLIKDGLGTVKAFISISTPWGGVRMAAEGLEHAPQVIPSWYDVAPESEFIQAIFSDTLSPQVAHYLIFGYHGDSSLFMANNDGTVEVSSQLDIRAQNDAMAVRGLDEDHMSILFSKQTQTYMNQALSKYFFQSGK